MLRLNTIIFIIVAVVCGLLPQSGRSSDVRMPPTIVKAPIPHKYYRSDDEITLECEATGVPEPEYEWRRNGAPIGSTFNIVRTAKGAIKIEPLTSLDEGHYECRAFNQYGTAVSRSTVLRQASIGHYQSSQPREETGLVEGRPHTIPCEPVKCFPQPTFTWALAEKGNDEHPTPVITNNRIQIDEQGNLHFAYLMAGDTQNNRVYKCNVLNPYLDQTIGGSYTRLQVSPSRPLRPFGPSKAFSSPSQVVAVEGHNVRLRCFFNGYPAVQLTWSKVNGRLPSGRYEMNDRNSELLIKNVSKADEGDYKCEGSNTNGRDHVIVQVDVQWDPKFESPDDKPKSTNITEGEQLRFPCRVTAEPIAEVSWFKNGEALNAGNLPSRMRIVDNVLILDDVCKNCDDRATDLQVIQCNASNVHGYQFIDAYINVLLRTKITDVPQGVHLTYSDTLAEFYCAAISDDSTPVSIQWYKFGRHGRSPVTNRTGRVNVTVSHDGTTLSFMVGANDTEGWARLAGDYQAVATNGYSSEAANFSVLVDMPLAPDQPTSTPAVAAVAEGSTFLDYWWVLLIIAILLLIILLIIICCICCKRCKGDTYYVDKKEKRDQKDPEKELADSALQPYRRPDADPLKSGPGIGDPMEGDSDEDEESLNEYGDIDAGKFTEDGSFIGDYHSEQRNRGRPGDSYA